MCGVLSHHVLKSYFFFPHLPELQAAFCIHSDPAPVAKHSEGFLEIGAGLPLHIHRDAQRRRPSTGKPDLIHVHTHSHTHAHVHITENNPRGETTIGALTNR